VRWSFDQRNNSRPRIDGAESPSHERNALEIPKARGATFYPPSHFQRADSVVFLFRGMRFVRFR
jgi:hypothetical protein